MRATSIRRLSAGAAALLLAGATILSATGAALAAVPLASATSEASPPAYSAGNAAGFRGTFRLTDTSTLAKLYLNLKTTSADANVYFSATRNGTDVARNCTVGAALTSCVFKTVRTDDVFVVISAYSTSATAVTANFVWSTTGSTGSDGSNTSHGDTWDDIPRTATLNPDPNYGGGFVFDGSGIQNDQVVTPQNRQATRLAGLPAGIAATVQDGPDASGSCGTYVCTTEFEWSEINVADGNTPFVAYITYYQGSPRYFIHDFLNAAGTPEQEQVGPCPKKNPAAAAPCFTWSARNSQATIYALRNGSWKGN